MQPEAQMAHTVPADTGNRDLKNSPRSPQANAFARETLTFRVIDAPNRTYGYDILGDGRLFVHQTNLPGMPGVEGCRTSADAEKLARYVIAKIRQGNMPPSITPRELDSLGIH